MMYFRSLTFKYLYSKVTLPNSRLKVNVVYFSSKIYFEEAKNRGIIRIKGKDASSFLQGLITNDVNHLDNSKSIYTLFLNTKGRIKFDSIIYKGLEEDDFFIESDRNALHSLEKHLKIYKLRKEVNVTNMDKDLNVFILYNIKSILKLIPEMFKPSFPLDMTSIVDAMNEESLLNVNVNKVISIDPRIGALGLRLLCTNTADLLTAYSNHNIELIQLPSPVHKTFRFMLGIAEGVEEIPFEQCFPLEMNADFLHGVSFQKGCYIGQELTARTYHTGVIRKRIMPILFDSNDTKDLPVEVHLPDGNKNVGKLRAAHNKYGIALLRVKECLSSLNLKIGNIKAQCTQPLWWPHESNKEKMLNI